MYNTVFMWLLFGFPAKSVASVLHPNLSTISAKPHDIQLSAHHLHLLSRTYTAVHFHPEAFRALTHLVNYSSAPGFTPSWVFWEDSLPPRRGQVPPLPSILLISKPILTNVIMIIILYCIYLLVNDHLWDRDRIPHFRQSSGYTQGFWSHKA